MRLDLPAFVGVLLVSSTSHAEILPELPPDPEIVDTVENLAPGDAVRLPDFAVIGDGLDAFESFATRGPGIRDFCDKWIWAEDRGRALYAGGNHGAPHKFDDLWEYDLESNTWVMLHAPDPDVAPSHTWWGFTYDQARSRVLWMAPTTPGTWDTGGYEGPPLRSYDTQAQAGWELLMTEPQINVSLAAALEYIPERDVVLFHANQWNGSGLQQLDPETNVWTELIPQGELYFDNPDAPPAEAIITYNAGSDVLVGFRDRSVYVYDFETNAWTRVLEEAGDEDFYVSDSQSGSDYDPVADVHHILTGGRLWAYDAKTNELTDLEVELAPAFGMVYFDRELGVVVMYDETSSHVVYRHAPLPDPGDDESSGGAADESSTGEPDVPDDPDDPSTTSGSTAPDEPMSGGTGDPPDADAPSEGSDGGCSCRAADHRNSWVFLFAIFGLIVRRR